MGEQDHQATLQRPVTEFRGYAPPTSSTTYTPNQFFDLVLPNASRGCLRLVAYLIRKTLGWSDAQGNPQNPQATISYRELEKCAGIGRGRVKEAIDEAIAGKYIECLRFGKPHQAGEAGYSALYCLKWGNQERYVTDREEFDGFFAGNGNLTHIPNDFFDYTIPTETLAVVKVVGVIIRNTIGFQTKFGFRRQEAALSFSDIMRRVAIGSRTTVSEALKAAIAGSHIRLISPGCFDQNAGRDSRAAVYGVNWNDSPQAPAAPKRHQCHPRHASKSGPRSQNISFNTSEESAPNLDRIKCPEIGPAKVPGTRPATAPKLDPKAPRNWTDKERTHLNNPSKQHQTEACAAGVELAANPDLIARLVTEGVAPRVADRLARRYPGTQILRQLEWISQRQVRSSRIGLLIRAIECDMEGPAALSPDVSPGREFAAHFYAELAGNPETPVAQPSNEETRISGDLIRRLKTTEPPGDLGRDFARFVIKRSQGTRFAPQAVALALRLHADLYFRFREDERATNRSLAVAREKEAHEALMAPKYAAYVSAVLRQHLSDPLLSTAFESDCAAKLESCHRLSKRGYDMLRKDLDSAEGKDRLFLEFLQRKDPSLVPDFWHWDSSLNDEPFSQLGGTWAAS